MNGKPSGNGQMDRTFMNLKNKSTPEGILPCPGAIYMYVTSIVKQIYWYISQI